MSCTTCFHHIFAPLLHGRSGGGWDLLCCTLLNITLYNFVLLDYFSVITYPFLYVCQLIVMICISLVPIGVGRGRLVKIACACAHFHDIPGKLHTGYACPSTFTHAHIMTSHGLSEGRTPLPKIRQRALCQ